MEQTMEALTLIALTVAVLSLVAGIAAIFNAKKEYDAKHGSRHVTGDPSTSL
jgi:hypothetical protein